MALERCRDQISKYWQLALNILKEIPEWRVLSRKVSYMGDTAMIYVILNARLGMHNTAGAVPGEIRSSIALRKNAGEWSIYHYHESRQLEMAEKAGIAMDARLGVELPERVK